MVEDFLDEDGKPAFSSYGYKKTSDWKDAEGNPIMPPRPYMWEFEGGRRRLDVETHPGTR